MAEFDLVIRGGTVVSAAETMHCDIGIRDGRIVALAEGLSGEREIDAGGLLVLPGGVDTHCHVEQLEADGSVHEEDFVTASASALAGGTTTIVPFANQVRGRPISDSLAEYRSRAARAMIDYGMHQIITDPTDEVIREEIRVWSRQVSGVSRSSSPTMRSNSTTDNTCACWPRRGGMAHS